MALALAWAVDAGEERVYVWQLEALPLLDRLAGLGYKVVKA